MRLLIPLLFLSFISLGQTDKLNLTKIEVKVDYVYKSKSTKGLLYTLDSNAIYLISRKQFRALKKGIVMPIAEAKFVPITSVDIIYTRKAKRVVPRIIGVGIGLYGVAAMFSGGLFVMPGAPLVVITGILVAGFNWKYFKPHKIGADQSNYLTHIAGLNSLCIKK